MNKAANRNRNNDQFKKKFVNWLESRMEQKWADIYKELSLPENADLKDMGKISQILGIKTSIKDGKVRIHHAGGLTTLDASNVMYYVDPKEGAIVKNPYPAQRAAAMKESQQKERQALDSRVKKISEDTLLVKQGEQWVAVQMDVLTEDKAGFFDQILKRRVYLSIWSDCQELLKLYGIKNMYAKDIRVLTQREQMMLKQAKVI